MINEEYSKTLIDLAYAEAERRIVQAALDIAEKRNKGYTFFTNFNIRQLVDDCHEHVLQEHMGDE
jgi:hypothetical protein